MERNSREDLLCQHSINFVFNSPDSRRTSQTTATPEHDQTATTSTQTPARTTCRHHSKQGTKQKHQRRSRRKIPKDKQIVGKSTPWSRTDTRSNHQGWKPMQRKGKNIGWKKQEPSRATNNCPDGFIRTTQTILGHSLHKVPDRQRDPADTRASRSSSIK